ncbi:hypothetical protein [Polaromonas sp. CG9_12]|nr:hypothetical protein [Polaromonas sp. CG9_12]
MACLGQAGQDASCPLMWRLPEEVKLHRQALASTSVMGKA